jgi:hypothetical protein
MDIIVGLPPHSATVGSNRRTEVPALVENRSVSLMMATMSGWRVTTQTPSTNMGSSSSDCQ